MKKKEVTIKDLAELLIPKLWIIIIVSVLASVLAFGYSHFFKTDTYTATSKLYVNSASGEGDDVTTGDNIVVARHMLDNYKVILKSEVFLKEVIAKLEADKSDAEQNNLVKDLTPSKISGMMSISVYEDTQAFSLKVTSTNPRLSCIVLKAIHNTAVDTLGEIVNDAKTYSISSLQDPPEDYKVITKNSNHAARNAVLSFLVAAVMSVVFIWVYSFFDVIIRDRKKLVDNVDVPILGVIPKHEISVQAKGGVTHV